MASPNEVMTRQALDQAYRQVWVMLADAMDELGIDFVTEDDAEVWGAIARHPAIQERLVAP